VFLAQQGKIAVTGRKANIAVAIAGVCPCVSPFPRSETLEKVIAYILLQQLYRLSIVKPASCTFPR
jgi:hypothetical protein